MYSVFYFLVIFLFLAAAGMAVANRKVAPEVRKQRWMKYFFYLLITAVVIGCIFLNIFPFLSLLIVAAGYIELMLINNKGSKSFVPVSFIVYGLLSAGFIFFAWSFEKPALLFIYFQVLIFDGFCQISGQLFGKHLLVPVISPTKTIEGLVGGWFFCLIAALLGAGWMQVSLPVALLSGLFTGFTCFCGDVLASWFKRREKIKDFSNWLPGQGGVIDRFDSFIFTGAIYFSGYLFMNLIQVRH